MIIRPLPTLMMHHAGLPINPLVWLLHMVHFYPIRTSTPWSYILSMLNMFLWCNTCLIWKTCIAASATQIIKHWETWSRMGWYQVCPQIFFKKIFLNVNFVSYANRQRHQFPNFIRKDQGIEQWGNWRKCGWILAACILGWGQAMNILWI